MNKLIVKLEYNGSLCKRSKKIKKIYEIEFHNEETINQDLVFYNVKANFDKNMVLNVELSYIGAETIEKRFFLTKDSAHVFIPVIKDVSAIYTFTLK